MHFSHRHEQSINCTTEKVLCQIEAVLGELVSSELKKTSALRVIDAWQWEWKKNWGKQISLASSASELKTLRNASCFYHNGAML